MMVILDHDGMKGATPIIPSKRLRGKGNRTPCREDPDWMQTGLSPPSWSKGWRKEDLFTQDGPRRSAWAVPSLDMMGDCE